MDVSKLVFFLAALAFFISCDPSIEKEETSSEQPLQLTARETYYATFNQANTQLNGFKKAFSQAKKDSVMVSLPYAESGVFSSEESITYSYDIQLREGEKVFITLSRQSISGTVLIDLFQKNEGASNELKLLKSAAIDDNHLVYEIASYGYYKVIVQPALQLNDSFQFKMYTQPIYSFPVAGATNDDVKSFWAANRGEGKRSHEGIDIFADMGTPLLAITDGVISRINEEGKGGKQVRLNDPAFKNTIYYAHLDAFAVEQGQQVREGDTIGFVGNTGNAETTESHLHFGIYKNIAGPIDPYPYVKFTEVPEIEKQNHLTKASAGSNETLVHQGPSEGLAKIVRLAKNDTVTVLGQYRSWYHVLTQSGHKGFLKSTRVAPLN